MASAVLCDIFGSRELGRFRAQNYGRLRIWGDGLMLLACP